MGGYFYFSGLLIDLQSGTFHEQKTHVIIEDIHYPSR